MADLTDSNILSLEEEVKVLKMELEGMAWAVRMKETERAAMEEEVVRARRMVAEIEEWKARMGAEMEELRRKLEVSMEAEERMAKDVAWIEAEAMREAVGTRDLVESLRAQIRGKDIRVAAAAMAARELLHLLLPHPDSDADDAGHNDQSLDDFVREPCFPPDTAMAIATPVSCPDDAATIATQPGAAARVDQCHAPPHQSTPNISSSSVEIVSPSLNTSTARINSAPPSAAMAEIASPASISLAPAPAAVPVPAPAPAPPPPLPILRPGLKPSSTRDPTPILTSLSNSVASTPYGPGSVSHNEHTQRARRHQRFEQASKSLHDRASPSPANVATSPSMNTSLRRIWWAWSKHPASTQDTSTTTPLVSY